MLQETAHGHVPLAIKDVGYVGLRETVQANVSSFPPQGLSPAEMPQPAARVV
jgi:hypothetical protein